VIGFNEIKYEIKSRIIYIKLEKNPTTYAKNLYKNLRFLDKSRIDMIIILNIPYEESWFGIRDRLKKSSLKKGQISNKTYLNNILSDMFVSF
jgi:hypothetical protein